MPALSDYSNVYATAIFFLEKKGYQVWLDERAEQFFAEKNGWDFQADSPCGLLGLVAIFEEIHPETFEEYWWRPSGGEGQYKISTKTPSYTPVWQKRSP